MGRRKVEVHAWSNARLACAEVRARLGNEAAEWARELFWLGLHPDGYSRPRDEHADPVLHRRLVPVEERRRMLADIVCCVLEPKFRVEFTAYDAVLLKATIGRLHLANDNVDGFEQRRKQWDQALQRARKLRHGRALTGAVHDLDPESALEILAGDYLRSEDDERLSKRHEQRAETERVRLEVDRRVRELLGDICDMDLKSLVVLRGMLDRLR